MNLDPDAPLALRSKHHREANFDITAMIDLVFMMNIFFLVTTVAAAQLEIGLPTMRHCVPTDPEEAVIITVTSNVLPTVSIGVGSKDLESGLTDPDQQKEAIQRGVRQAVQGGKKIILIRAEQAIKLREIKRLCAAATEGTTDMELRFSVIETDRFP